MSAFHIKKPRKKPRLILAILAFLVLVAVAIIGTVAASFYWYQQNIQPLAVTEEEIIVVIDEGASVLEIGKQLETASVIRSATAFDWYTRLNSGRTELQAGGYKFSPGESVAEIVARLREGDVATDLITILPAKRIDEVRSAFLRAGYSREEIAEAFKPEQYANHPALQFKPAKDSLEGYLYPETFHRTLNTSAKDIITLALDEMAAVITSDLRKQLQNQGLGVHEAVILASIVEREVGNPDDRAKVAQVFLKRYREGIMLGSDSTALYGALIAGIEPSVSADTPYNTRLYVGLPPTPINNVSAESLQALANPADTDYLFFVSGDDGKTYFSHTLAEHEALTAQHCVKLCRSY